MNSTPKESNLAPSALEKPSIRSTQRRSDDLNFNEREGLLIAESLLKDH